MQLAQFAVRGAAFDAEDRAITPAVRVTLAPFNLTVRNLSQDLHKPLAVALDTGINEKGRFETSGSVVPVPLQADLDVKLGHLGLAVAQPYLAQQTALTLQSGELDASGKLQVQVPADRQAKPPLSLHFAGEAAVDGLRTLDNQVRQDLVSWHRVQVRGIDPAEAVLTNALGTRNLAEAALPYLEMSGQASFCAISSISGEEDYGYGSVSYGTMKAALFFYVKSFARHVAPKGIRANIVSPGTTYFKGGYWHHVEVNDPERFARNLAENPLGRMATPEEIGNAVVFLASGAASFISGTNLTVDGTLTIRIPN